jgi:hypothetical protein
MKTERIAKVLGWTIVGAILASTAALVAGIGVLARMQPEAPTPHSEEDEPPADAEDIGEQAEERSLNDERELREPSPEEEGGGTGAEPGS